MHRLLIGATFSLFMLASCISEVAGDGDRTTRGRASGGQCSANLFFGAEVTGDGHWSFQITSNSVGTWGDIKTDLNLSYREVHRYFSWGPDNLPAGGMLSYPCSTCAEAGDVLSPFPTGPVAFAYNIGSNNGNDQCEAHYGGTIAVQPGSASVPSAPSPAGPGGCPGNGPCQCDNTNSCRAMYDHDQCVANYPGNWPEYKDWLIIHFTDLKCPDKAPSPSGPSPQPSEPAPQPSEPAPQPSDPAPPTCPKNGICTCENDSGCRAMWEHDQCVAGYPGHWPAYEVWLAAHMGPGELNCPSEEPPPPPPEPPPSTCPENGICTCDEDSGCRAMWEHDKCEAGYPGYWPAYEVWLPAHMGPGELNCP